ncbi:arf-GAP with SH3 domain: ANK repeat and PH domain-containing protein 2-like protein [Dinothrombium tinctorium]|uniref:Arf-GAP with SH3 domain: ANK repeat and PH domain-containing protein 2-like protein n=1 Tax=Dinothrombium tinctorium TaxID=1965070 RepID=A0A3S3NTK6_9ACAR|nr:arf-GAP with SH3 domain: ANK repeat and PH domain-containing protein 2-like protein [Dinothrombium tinctorium]
MPGLMSVNEFLAETREDFNSPTTSTFVTKMANCKHTVGSLEESLDFDRDGLTKMKKAVKAIYNGGNSHVDNEVYLAKALERLGANAMTKDQEPDIGAAFIKFSIVTKELSALMKTLMQSLNNIIMFPLDNILKGDLKGVKGDLKKPFDKAWRDYETKIVKIEKEKKQQAKEVGLIRTEISPAEIAEEMDKERKMYQLQMCEYLIKVNEIKTKKGVELLQHLVDYYHAQTSYFQDGLKTIEHFNGYISELSVKLQQIKQKQDEERKKLIELRTLLRSSTSIMEYCAKESSVNSNSVPNSEKKDKGGYSLHQLQGNKHYGYSKVGYLSKKSEGKMKVKVWQKRKCEVKDGFLYIYHSDESKVPTKVNLLTCQVKTIPDEKRAFDLISYNRTYHFQSEDENEADAWISVLINSKEGALKKEFDSNHSTLNASSIGDKGLRKESSNENQSLCELRQSIISQIQKLPGNDKCVDCSSKDPTWLSTNFGVLTCIECSGVHRDLGVHISRIQSLTLDNIGTSQLLLARVMSNNGFNDIMEATLSQNQKLTPTSTMEQRFELIRAKYVDKKFAIRSCSGDINDLKSDLEHAVVSRHLYHLVQVFAEGADLTWILPGFAANGETSLHVAVAQEDNTTLHIVDFLVQNSSDIDKQTKKGNTALHICVEHNKSECMKLLLRSGANVQIENLNGKTPLDLAKEKGFDNLVELLEHALQNKKSLFENLNIDWSLTPNEDVSTDFSDDDIGEDKQQQQQPQTQQLQPQTTQTISRPESQPQQTIQTIERLPNRSRPSSVVGSESPSSRSSDSFKSKKIGLFAHGGSIKKKAAPPPPNKMNTSGDESSSSSGGARAASNKIYAHTRTTSDTSALGNIIGIHHQKNLSIDLGSGDYGTHGGEAGKGTLKLKQVSNAQNQPIYASLQRPRCPPPPLPAHQNIRQSKRLSNGQSIESLPSLSSETEDAPVTRYQSNIPVPPPRKSCPPRNEGSIKLRRCRALYDCEADRDDELAFKEGEIIVILNEKTDDEDWMEGMIEGEPHRKGVFPTSFVQMLSC